MTDDPTDSDFREQLGTAIAAALRGNEIDPEGEHQLRFIFIAESEPGIQGIVAELEPDGFACEVDQLDDGGWFCLAQKSLPIDVALLDTLGRRFLQLGRAKGGEFDGWDRVPTFEELLASGAELTIGKLDADEVDLEQYPHAVSVRLAESIQPVNRGERYEEPLGEALAEHELGAVTGGGSQLSAEGEIRFVRLDLQLANLDRAVTLVRRVVEEAGAPIGSTIEFEDDGRAETIEIGTHQAVAIYLDGASLPDEVYEQSDVNVLAGAIGAALENGTLGELRDYWEGSTETALYLYGPNAERVFAAVEPVLRGYPLGQNARVVIRPGTKGAEPREIRIPRR
jgi:hypothetical protein